jgi:hypothetical protein
MIEIRRPRKDDEAFERSYPTDERDHPLNMLLYLDDVDEVDASLFYPKGSHTAAWPCHRLIPRGCRERPVDNAARANTSDIACFGPRANNLIETRRGYPEFACCGPVGSLVMYDGRRVRRTTPPAGSLQTLLVDCWELGSASRMAAL